MCIFAKYGLNFWEKIMEGLLSTRKNAANLNRYGFTLVELLVVISIIAILLAVLIPALNAARNQAKGAMCLSNMKQIGLAIECYKAENKDSYCHATGWRARYPATYKDYMKECTWWGFISKYAKDAKIKVCPANQKWMFGHSFNAEFGFCEPDPNMPTTSLVQPDTLPLKGGQVVTPATKILITEGSLTFFECYIGWKYTQEQAWMYSHRIFPASKEDDPADREYWMRRVYGYKEAYLHNQNANNLFADGHAVKMFRKKMRAPELWFPNPQRLKISRGNPWSMKLPTYWYKGD